MAVVSNQMLPLDVFNPLCNEEGSVMIDFWWQVFLASVITVVVAKVLGLAWGILLIFSVAFLVWTALFVALLWLSSLRQK